MGSAKQQPMSHSTGMSIPESRYIAVFTPREWQQECVGSHKQMALLQPHYHLNNHKDNLEVHLSKEAVKEQNLSLLLTIDSHHQQ